MSQQRDGYPRKKRSGGGDDGIAVNIDLRLNSGPYRSRDGWVLGVCMGIARHFDIPVSAVRLGVVVTAMFTSFVPVIIGYIIAAFLMRPAPIVPLQSEEDAEFYNSYISSRGMALHRLQRTFENLDRRIQRMESIVTDREYDWERRLDRDV